MRLSPRFRHRFPIMNRRKGTLEDTFDPPDRADTTHPALRIRKRQASYRSLVGAMRWALNTLMLKLETDPDQIQQSAHFADQAPMPWDMPDYPQHEREELFVLPLPDLESIQAILGRVDMQCPYLMAIFNSALYGEPCMEPIRPLQRDPATLPDKLRNYSHEARRTVNVFTTREPIVQAIDMLKVAADRIEQLEQRLLQLLES